MNKKKILLVSEYSKLNTGFGVMANEILTHLHATGKYELAELASYITDDHPGINNRPWKVYPAQPSPNDKEATQQYRENYTENQFGALRFEDTILDFRPDIVFSYRDFWHDAFILKSPFRHLFYYIWSACVDSEPPRPEWLDAYSTVDCMSSYSEWGLNVLKKYGGENFMNVSDTHTMPGVDIDTFHPMDQAEVRRKYGLQHAKSKSKLTQFPTLPLIIGMCARNQPRKLFPTLISSFMNMIEILHADGREELANNTFLYLHTSLVDVGYDLIQCIKDYQASHKVLLTYYCPKCNKAFVSYVTGPQQHCEYCGQFCAITPNTGVGVSRETLAEIYNLADLYVQVQVAGACEMPLVEARSCGLPTLAVNYAAPAELQQLPGSFDTVKVGAYREEGKNETAQFRAYVDADDLTKKLLKFTRLTPEAYFKLKTDARKTAEQYHSFEVTAKSWEKLFENAPTLSDDRWTQTPRSISLTEKDVPWQLNNEQLVHWLCNEALPPKDILRSFLNEKRLLGALNYGFMLDRDGGASKFTKEDLLRIIINNINKWNHFEQHRFNILVTQPEKKEKEYVNYRLC